MTMSMSPNDATLSATANELLLTAAAIEASPEHNAGMAEMIDRQDGLVALLEGTKPATDIGLVAKAAALLAVGSECTIPSHQERLAISLATDILRIFGGRVLPIISAAPGVGLTPVKITAASSMRDGPFAPPEAASVSPKESAVRC